MKLSIYQEKLCVGSLSTSDKGISFRYTQEFLATKTAAISLSLPLQVASFAQERCLPFFDGLLPEEQQRIDLSRLLHTSATSPMKLLAALAGECVGNLTILDEEMTIDEALQSSGYRELSMAELESLLQPQSMTRLGFIADRRLSLAGAQAKFGLYRSDDGQWFATQGLAPTTHIIKPASSRFDTLLMNEFFIMQLAAACDIPTAETQIVTAGSQHGLAVRRFDRQRVDDTVHRIAQEDFCQALAVMSHGKYEEDGGPGFANLFMLVQENLARPQAAARELLRLSLFNYLVGNEDAHAKNYSIVRNPATHGLELAPAYDLISTTFYQDLAQSLAMKMGTHYRIDRINSDDLAIFAHEIGISHKVVHSELQTLLDTIKSQLEAVTGATIDALPHCKDAAYELKAHLNRELEQRAKLL